MISLSARVSLSAALVLTIFIALTALTLDRAFEESARSAMRERLFAQLYLVMAAAEVSDSGMLAMPGHLTEARLELPGSGLYARISDGSGNPLWHSASSVGLAWPATAPLPMGGERFERLPLEGRDYFHASLAVEWETLEGSVPLAFSLLEEPTAFEQQMQRYRHSLWGWLGATAVVLLLALAGTLAWGLRPLRRVAREVQAIESGRQQSVEQEYPGEIRRLTDNINTLLHHERTQQARYKNALADLAHSLKTPLAVLRGLDESERSPEIDAQIARMDNIVQYQLQRAATAGRSALSAPVPVAPLAERLLATLQKVYPERAVTLEREIAPGSCFHGDEGDLMELLGNLLDNAWKWTRQRIWLTVRQHERHLHITVEDDGPGFDAEGAQRALARGIRLDEAAPGHGIGLPMVRDIVEAYEGSLTIDRSRHGGARIAIVLPQ